MTQDRAVRAPINVVVISDSQSLAARIPTERAERAIELAKLFRRVREAQLEFLRLHEAELASREAEAAVPRRDVGRTLSDPDTSEVPHGLNRPFKHQRLSFDP
jgi:hypothetical protein